MIRYGMVWYDTVWYPAVPMVAPWAPRSPATLMEHCSTEYTSTRTRFKSILYTLMNLVQSTQVHDKL